MCVRSRHRRSWGSDSADASRRCGRGRRPVLTGRLFPLHLTYKLLYIYIYNVVQPPGTIRWRQSTSSI